MVKVDELSFCLSCLKINHDETDLQEIIKVNGEIGEHNS